jgi:hypothetical protein
MFWRTTVRNLRTAKTPNPPAKHGQLSSTVVLIPFVAFGELQRVLGEGKLGLIFFHPRPFENQPSKS